MIEKFLWWKRLMGEKSSAEQPIVMGDLALVPATLTELRVESALPGTKTLEPLLNLVPPPSDPDRDDRQGPDRDYAPCPISDWSITFEAATVFDCSALAESLYARHELYARPTYHVRTPEGRVTYLTSKESPPYGVALIPAWSLASWAEPDPAKISAGAEALASALAEQSCDFTVPKFSLPALETRFRRATRVAAINPRTVTIWASHPDGDYWDGRGIWDLLHRLGLRWGNMDCFHWIDPTNPNENLVWAEVDDGELGYALPERVAAGSQHFRTIRFSFEILRSPAPTHVLGQLESIVSACQQILGCRLVACLDGDVVPGIGELRRGVLQVENALAELDLKPGSEAVCRLT